MTTRWADGPDVRGPAVRQPSRRAWWPEAGDLAAMVGLATADDAGPARSAGPADRADRQGADTLTVLAARLTTLLR